MPKNLLQDIVKIKNPRKEIFKKEIYRENIPKNAEVGEIEKQTGTGPKYGLWFVAIISIVFFIFALSFLFAKAEVTVNPKVENPTLNENLSAIKDSSSDGLSFDLVVISGEESKNIAGGEEKEISLNSQGTVVLYNAFSSLPQNLSINTKLEGSNGKIYKTVTAITVPGMNEDAIPGQVETEIYGAEAGEAYNSAPLDFKVLGFKGTPKYSKFYGRSKGEITGGFKGRSPVLSDIEKENAFSELKTTLQEKLLKKAAGQIPDGFILFKDAVFLNVDEQSVAFVSEGNELPVKIKGTLYGFLFNEQKLTKKITEDSVANYDESDVYIPNIKDLIFSLPDSGISFSDVQNINFNLSGPAKIIWRFDNAKLSAELLGKAKKDFNQILSQYPNIESANLVLSPFWVRTLPSKTKDIKIIVNYPK